MRSPARLFWTDRLFFSQAFTPRLDLREKFINSGKKHFTDSTSYNGFAEPVSYQAAHSGTTVFNAQYIRDSLGRITQKTETIDGATTIFDYSYDLAGRLTEVKENGAVVSTYVYDGNGNRLSLTTSAGTVNGTYDDQDRLVTYGNAAYTYTDNGELFSKTVGGQITSYNYDVLGNLLSVTLSSGIQIDYVVDGRNRRIGKKVNGTLVQGLLYQDQLRPVAELDGSNNIVSRFVYASGPDVPDYIIKGGITYRIISDHVGSPRVVLDVSTGVVVQQMAYDEFGNVTLDTNPGFQPFGFAGGLYDQHTKLTRFGMRDYDAETGRWTAKDPIRFLAGNTNLYGYGVNDPVNFVDPSGLFVGSLSLLTTLALDVGTAIAAAGIGTVGTAIAVAGATGYAIGTGIDYLFGDQIHEFIWDHFGPPQVEAARKGKYTKPPNPNRRRGAERRQQTGERERNVGHPDGEEHSRVPKGPKIPRGPKGPGRGCP